MKKSDSQFSVRKKQKPGDERRPPNSTKSSEGYINFRSLLSFSFSMKKVSDRWKIRDLSLLSVVVESCFSLTSDHIVV